ncbi:ASCH domain-containing protein [Desulfococcaceae bacterium HSG7]|nr:ASCH domain-containing protein [Desulfococcaceae bacterium HSG7]
MKALSVRQPWAWLIVHGYKDIENRTWKTALRGRFLVQAGLKFDYQGYADVLNQFKISLPPVSMFDLGGIVGVAAIVDCVNQSDSPWFSGPYGFILKNPQPLPFSALRGQLGFFNADY